LPIVLQSKAELFNFTKLVHIRGNWSLIKINYCLHVLHNNGLNFHIISSKFHNAECLSILKCASLVLEFIFNIY